MTAGSWPRRPPRPCSPAAASLSDGQKLYADIKGRMDKLGRDRDSLKILPGAFVVVGDSVEEAKEKRALLDSKVHYDSAISSLSVILGTDASGFDPDGQLPPIPETNASKSGRQRIVDVAARDKLTVRQLGAARRRLWRAVVRRHAAGDRRSDGGVADELRQ